MSNSISTNLAEGDARSSMESWRAVSAAVAGNILEWYDFAIYGYVATIIARNFFPSGDEVGALLATFATFGIGFVARPLGGIIIGRMGDTKGRKSALALTIFLTGPWGRSASVSFLCWNSIGELAPAAARHLPADAGFCRWRRMGRRDSLYRRMGAAESAWLFRELPASQRGRRAASGVGDRRHLQHAFSGRADGVLGMAYSIPSRHHPRTGRHVLCAATSRRLPVYRKAQEAPSGPQTPGWILPPRRSVSRSYGPFPITSSSITCRDLHGEICRAGAHAILWSNTIGLIILVVAIPAMGLLSG